MFDISFSELLLIGIIALIVLGPERLPKVARTVGHLFGRAQRYVSEVKTDIEREINLDEVKSIKNQVKDAAESVRASVDATTKQISNPLEEARRAVNDFANETEKSVSDAVQDHTKALSALEDDIKSADPAQAELPLSTKNQANADSLPTDTASPSTHNETSASLPSSTERTNDNTASEPQTEATASDASNATPKSTT